MDLIIFLRFDAKPLLVARKRKKTFFLYRKKKTSPMNKIACDFDKNFAAGFLMFVPRQLLLYFMHLFHITFLRIPQVCLSR